MNPPLPHFNGPLDAPRSVRIKDPTWLRPEIVASWGQIVFVLVIMVGPFAWKSNWAAWHGSSTRYLSMLVSDVHLISNGAYEGLLLAFFLWFMHRRGWKKADFKIKATAGSSFQAIPLIVAAEAANIIMVVGLLGLLFCLQSGHTSLVAFLAANGQHLKHHSVVISWVTIVGTMLLNAYFEELVCMGYAFNQFAAKQGPLFALLLTVLLRMSCHTYQGPIHMLGIGAVFLIFGFWYWQTRNLWTLILAHALGDTVSMGFIKVLFG